MRSPIANDAVTIAAMQADEELRRLRTQLFLAVAKYRYTHNFGWLGRPIIQMPQDIVALQELLWDLRPDRVIETGIAHGGSLMLHASILELLGGDRRVLGIDIDIRAPNRKAIEAHPLAHRIEMIEGSSIDPQVVEAARRFVQGARQVMVVLDSMHTHAHVLAELRAYSPLVTRGSYLVVCDTLIEDMPDDTYTNRPWGKGNNPKTAVWEFLAGDDSFVIDRDLESRIFFTVAPDGFLRRTK